MRLSLFAGWALSALSRRTKHFRRNHPKLVIWDDAGAFLCVGIPERMINAWPVQIIGPAVVRGLGQHVPRSSSDVARRDPEPV